MPNRLAGATSPYLLQHADNPIDWWEWSDAAFAERVDESCGRVLAAKDAGTAG